MEKFPNNISILKKEIDQLESDKGNKESEIVFRDTEGALNYRIEKKKEAQFVGAQLASLVVSVSPVFLQKIGYKEYSLSESVENHRDYESNEQKEILASELFLWCILGDYDHNSVSQHNTHSGVFFDFDQVGFEYNNFGAENKGEFFEGLDYIFDLAFFREMSSDVELFYFVKDILKSKILSFIKNIERESGLYFISSLCKKANYTKVSATDLQKMLLHRSFAVLEYK